jgi:hypothetical protein
MDVAPPVVKELINSRILMCVHVAERLP